MRSSGCRSGRRGAEATYGRLLERGAGKDTTTGHWEMMGVVLETPVPDVPDGFPPEVHDAVREATGSGASSATGRRAAPRSSSELGDEHVATGKPIVYTSAPTRSSRSPRTRTSCPCRSCTASARSRATSCTATARGGPGHRPAVRGGPGALRAHADGGGTSPRAAGPHLVLRPLQERGVPVVGVGKIGEIFVAARAWTSIRPHHRQHRRASRVLAALCREMDDPACCSPTSWTSTSSGDTATTWRASRAGSSSVDAGSPGCRARCWSPATLILCADHGVDPTTPSTDHSREYLPLLALGLAPGRYDGAQEDVGATAFAHLTGEEPPLPGRPIG